MSISLGPSAMWAKIVAGLLFFALVSIVAALPTLPGVIAASKTAGSGIALKRPDEFSLEGISVFSSWDGGEPSSLSAKSILGRKRTGAGGLVVYHDVMEVRALDVSITVQVDSEDEALLSHVFGGVKRFFSREGLPTPLGGAPSGNRSVLPVVFKNLSIRLQQSGQKEVTIAATRARLNSDSDTLVLAGQVVMTTPRDGDVHASQAVFSSEFDGIYLPAGYTIGDRRMGGRRLLVVDASGVTSEASSLPDVDYEDLIERREKLVLAHFLKAVPSELKPLLFLFLGKIGTRVSPEDDPSQRNSRR